MSLRSLHFFALSSMLALAGACGSSGDDDDDDVTSPDGGGNPGDPDGGGGAFTDLVIGDWELPAGAEEYRCVYKTIEQTTYATAFRPVIPLGTHHTVLTVGPKNREDGVYNCNAGTNYGAQVFGSGVGTNELHLPDGIAVKLEAGDQLLLNLHLFNFADTSLSGTSGTQIIAIPEADVQHVAEAIMVSKFNLVIPPGESTQTQTCSMSQDVTLISVTPHMHMLGTHMKVTADSTAMGSVVMLDDPYNFDEQTVQLLPEEIPMKAGDQIKVECSYNNTTGGTVYFGDSSLQEMCIAGTFRYPALDEGIFCGGFF